ncbi:MAG: hypothetical protein MUO80_03845 [Dehalococcoidia bacterium]|nr:hypothetical protein [Dehalococcoidia bacterium]
MKEVMKNEFMQVIEETRALLKENSEWKERYAGYAEEIRNNFSTIKGVRSTFREWSPLNVYLNISSAKSAKHSVGFELRYMGQTVARLTANKDGKHKLSTTRKFKDTNQRDFQCQICLSSADWGGRDARQFRGFFRKGPPRTGTKGNEEHNVQSMLLTEFSIGEDKVIRHIRPVTISGVRFPMPTPISASNPKNMKYSKHHGGGLDILVRTGTGGKATRLCIMELKDENERREPPQKAIQQAIAYATFIRELLRSDSGRDWWRLFGFHGEIPEPLELYAACVMPSNDNNDYSFRNMELKIEGDIIKLHYLYFSRENGRIIVKATSLPITQ